MIYHEKRVTNNNSYPLYFPGQINEYTAFVMQHFIQTYVLLKKMKPESVRWQQLIIIIFLNSTTIYHPTHIIYMKVEYIFYNHISCRHQIRITTQNYIFFNFYDNPFKLKHNEKEQKTSALSLALCCVLVSNFLFNVKVVVRDLIYFH